MSSAEDLMSAAATVPMVCAAAVACVAVLRVPAARRAGPAELVAGLGLALEFLLAAGLLRLASREELEMLALVGAIIVLRRLINLGLRAGLRALGLAQLRRIRA